jgi:integrase
MPPVREGSVFKLDKSGWAYRLPRDPITGKRPQTGGFRTKGEARIALDEAMTKQRLGHSYRPDTTFKELVDEFFAQYVGVSERTKRTMREWLMASRATFDDVAIERLDARAITAWRAALPSAKYAEKQLRALRQVLAYAVRVRLLDRNPAADVPITRIARNEIEPFDSWADIHAIASELPKRFRAIPVFAAGTGLRPEEWIALRVGDVNIAERVVTVARVYSSGEFRNAPEKGKGARRRVPLRRRVIAALAESERLGPGKDPKALLFPAERGGPIDLNNWRRREWSPAAISAGFYVEVDAENGEKEAKSTRTPYALRHTYAAWALAAGVNIYTLARRMGTSVQMIDATYGHFARDAEDYERDLLDGYDDALDAADETKREEIVKGGVA